MSRALENVRRLVEWNRLDCFVQSQSADAPRIERVGILGAGMMGTAIAAVHVRHRLPVVLYDVDEERLARAPASVAAELRASGASFSTETIARMVRTSSEPAEAAQCDLVLETIVESLPAKQRLFERLRGSLASHAILATNTSTIPIRRLAEKLPEASRFCGMHFFHPVRERPLVEIVRGPDTSDGTVALAVSHTRRIGRMPIVVQDGPGFVVNRLLFPYLGAALELLREGVSAESIEWAAAEFGMAVGPLRLIDEIGLDTTLHAGWVLATAFPERIASSPLLVSLVKAGHLGQKTGVGFFPYREPAKDASVTLDHEAKKIVDPWIVPNRKPSKSSIACRLVLPMLAEAALILDEGKVEDARAIDLAVLFGLGFPAEKGGLLWWAESLGPDRIRSLLLPQDGIDAEPRPSPVLHSLAEPGDGFYPAQV
jgi:3-hydroxyacyl-CoA dehydrogenase